MSAAERGSGQGRRRRPSSDDPPRSGVAGGPATHHPDSQPAPSNSQRARERTGEQQAVSRPREGTAAARRQPSRSASASTTAAPSSAGLYGSTTGANMARASVAELIGTAILVYAGTAVACGAILDKPTAGGAYDSLAVALAFGLTLTGLVAALGHISGAHLNPAVTLGLASTRRFPWNHVPAYLGAQLLGAVLGAVGTWLTYGGAARATANLAATYPADGVGVLQALLVEALITFVLVLVVISVATDERVPAAVAPLAVGFALAVGVLIGGPVTGGAVNPARALGPMLVSLNLDAFWLYIVGPVAGGVAAATVYGRFLQEAEPPE